MIDIETIKIVDILESRDYEEVKRWLRSFPNLELILRDGSIVYNKAIKDAHPKSVQVSDRFHILKNLTDYCKQYIKRIFKNKIEIGKLKNINSGEILHLKEKYDKITNAEAKSSDISKSKEYLINKVKELSSKGKSMRKIAEEMFLDRKTVKKYLESDGNWNHASRGVKKKSKLDNYKDLIKKMYIDGMSSKEIYLKIKTQGYTGSESLIRKFIADFRSETIEGN